MKINLHTPVEEVQIQIIPLIDVVFCILTFFLLAALQFTRQEEISINLPKSTTGTPSTTTGTNVQVQREILTLTIDAIGQTYVNTDLVKQEQLKQAFQQYLQQTPNAILALKISQTATYNDVIEIIDLWRQVGGDRISFVTTPTSSNPPTNLLPTSPYSPNPSVPGTPVLPNTAPIAPINPQSSPNLNLPTVPNPGISPTTPAEKLNSTPNR